MFALVPVDPLPPPAAGAVTCILAAGDAVAYLRRNVPQLDAPGQRRILVATRAADPRVAWIEDPARLRADRLIAGAQPDTTAPRLVAVDRP